jgi:hypothetical protein
LAFYLPHLTQENLQHNQIKKKSVLPAYKQYIMLFKNNKQSTRQIKPKMKRTFSASLWAVFALLSEMGLFFPSAEVFDFFFPNLSSSEILVWSICGGRSC